MLDFAGQQVLITGKRGLLADGIAGFFRQGGAHVVQLELAMPPDPQQIAAQMAGYPAADCVILIPDWWQFKPFMESNPADWDAAVEQNYEALVYVAQAAARQMIATGTGGSIIYLTSVMTLMPFALTAVAATTQAAFRAIIKMAAVDLAPHGIRVNSVAQGWVDDDATQPYLSGTSGDHIRASIPTGRAASVQEIAQVCALLASPLASYITGTVVPADGGYILTRSEGSTPLG